MMAKMKNSYSQTVLTLRNDFLFKVVYGSDTEESRFILMALLNKILRREENPIVDIEYKNPFQYRQYFDEKEMVLDIKVTTDSGEIIDVEMQFIWQKDLKERFIMYHGGLIRESLSRGEAYGKMKKTITIGIVDAVFLEDEESFINEYYFMNKDSHRLLSDESYICCIELPKVNRENKPIDALTPLELCLEYLKHADENGSEYVDALIRKGGKEFQMAQEMLRKATEDEILREQAIAREKFENDMITFNYYYREAEKARDEMKQKLEVAEQARDETQRNLEEAEQARDEMQRKLEVAEQARGEMQRKLEVAEQETARMKAELEAALEKAKQAR